MSADLFVEHSDDDSITRTDLPPGYYIWTAYGERDMTPVAGPYSTRTMALHAMTTGEFLYWEPKP